MEGLKTIGRNITDRLALSPDERAQKESCVGKILKSLGKVGINVTQHIEEEVDMAVHRDLQARRLPPNVKIPPRRQIFDYLKTMYQARGSVYDAIHSLMSPGGWTSSGGSFKLAEENGIQVDELIRQILEENGKAGFLEIGAGYAGLYDREKEGYEPKGVGKIVSEFRDKLGGTLSVHLTNLTGWHEDLPEGIREHEGLIASTIETLTDEGVKEDDIDVVYSQCAAYFDANVDLFIEQAARFLKHSNAGGYLIFNGKTEEDEKITRAATASGLELKNKKVIGGMNGTLYIFKKLNT